MGWLSNLIKKEVDKAADSFIDSEWEKYASSKLPDDVSPELAAEMKGYIQAGDAVPAEREAAIRAEIGDEAYESFEKVRGVVETHDKADKALQTIDDIDSGLKKIGL